MLAFIYSIVIWIIVPFIIFALLMLALIIISSITIPENKVSALAGFGTGLVIFIIYVIVISRIPNTTTFNIKYLPSFDFSALSPLVTGFVVGFSLLWLLSVFLQTSFIGIITLILAATSSSALFSYYFSRDYKDLVLFAALGLILGLLFHLIFFPKSLKAISLKGQIMGVGIMDVVFVLTGILTITNLILAIISLF